MKIIVTGGAGFIGSHLVRHLLTEKTNHVLTLDKLTYAGRLENLSEALINARHSFEQGDVADRALVARIIQSFNPDLIIHLAAESHVDKSIDCADNFIQTNIVGTYNLLECAFQYWISLSQSNKSTFKFLHVSTDEVFGTLNEGYFTESSTYQPNSPYAASKASSDLLVRSYHKTHGFPSIIVNCSNNYGPNQFPEKLIPLCILNALEGRSLPIYGDGLQIRDWLYVEDHVEALQLIAEKGKSGENYCIGGNNERTNTEVVQSICTILDDIRPRANGKNHSDLIQYVNDRPGHDRRYAINSKKLFDELNWEPLTNFYDGLKKTIVWYLNNPQWVSSLNSKADVRIRQGLRFGNNQTKETFV